MDERNLTQVEVAQAVGVTQGTVSGWLRGSSPQGDVLLRMSRFFGVTVETLLTGKALAINSADEVWEPLPANMDMVKVLNMASQAIATLTALRDQLEAEILARKGRTVREHSGQGGEGK